MTQKELAYVEDAIGHETNIIKILTDNNNSLENEDIITFINSEISKHENMKEKLLNLLEEHTNE